MILLAGRLTDAVDGQQPSGLTADCSTKQYRTPFVTFLLGGWRVRNRDDNSGQHCHQRALRSGVDSERQSDWSDTARRIFCRKSPCQWEGSICNGEAAGVLFFLVLVSFRASDGPVLHHTVMTEWLSIPYSRLRRKIL